MRTGGLNWKKESLKLKDEFYTLERFKMTRFKTLKAGALAVLMMMPAVASAQDSSFDLQGLERGEVLITSQTLFFLMKVVILVNKKQHLPRIVVGFVRLVKTELVNLFMVLDIYLKMLNHDQLHMYIESNH